MPIEIKTPGEDELAEMARVDGIAFGSVWTDEEFAQVRPTIDESRFRIAVEAGEVIGVAGSFGFETTLPGGASIPTGGVTWVAVLVTHRRQGLLTRMLAEVHADIDAREEPLAALTASEGQIYERFGYGAATRDRNIEIDRRRAQFRPEFATPVGGVWLAHGEDLSSVLTDRWNQARLTRPGEISRSPDWQRKLIHQRGAACVTALHDDGYAAWTVTQNWDFGHPAHRLALHELAASTPEAHLALWQTVLSVDLVGPVTSSNVPFDDPLAYLLVNPRSLRTVSVNDGIWLNVRDVPRVFSARSYGTADEVVIEADGVRWRIGGSGCAKVRSRPDLVTDHASLSSLVLGGVRPSALVAGRRMETRNAETLRRADALFVNGLEPYCQTGF